MFENPRRGRQARNFTKSVPKILDLRSSSEQLFSEKWRWVPLKSQTKTPPCTDKKPPSTQASFHLNGEIITSLTAKLSKTQRLLIIQWCSFTPKNIDCNSMIRRFWIIMFVKLFGWIHYLKSTKKPSFSFSRIPFKRPLMNLSLALF